LRLRIEQMEVPGFGRATASFGVASFPAHASSRDTLVVAADRALYHSKRGGRNRVSLPDEENPEGLPENLEQPANHFDLTDALQRL
jgi:predicted signal transduction protein with EAL and GGDEF domain